MPRLAEFLASPSRFHEYLHSVVLGRTVNDEAVRIFVSRHPRNPARRDRTHHLAPDPPPITRRPYRVFRTAGAGLHADVRDVADRHLAVRAPAARVQFHPRAVALHPARDVVPGGACRRRLRSPHRAAVGREPARSPRPCSPRYCSPNTPAIRSPACLIPSRSRPSIDGSTRFRSRSRLPKCPCRVRETWASTSGITPPPCSTPPRIGRRRFTATAASAGRYTMSST